MKSSISDGFIINDIILCGMIKWKESDLTDITFEILAKTESQFFCFILFWDFDKFLTKLTRCLILFIMGFASNCSIFKFLTCKAVSLFVLHLLSLGKG